MVVLCGVVYPVSAMPAALQAIAQLLPLTYTVSGLRSAFSGDTSGLSGSYLALMVFLLIFLFPAMALLRKKFE